MSAAVWSEPTDAHERIGRVRITPSELSGRVTRNAVRLHIWGATEQDRRDAEHDARTDQRVTRYRIIEVVQADTPTPSAGDYAAIAHDVRYDRTWAAYPANAK